MINLCTLFDSYYVHKGLALYQSLINTTDDFTLYVMAFDVDTYDFLKKLSLKNMVIEYVAKIESETLLKLKAERTKAEYCWTCGPSVISYFINEYNLSYCIYVDADMMFINSPQLLINEIGDNSVAISEHHTDESITGKYCVQFMYFKNDNEGLKVLHWWRDRCIEWCYSRYENGKFGDQKYLESFYELTNKLWVIKSRGLIAPWNMNRYIYPSNEIAFFEGVSYPIVFFHFHGTCINDNNGILSLDVVAFDITDKKVIAFFDLYANLMKDIYNKYFNSNIYRCSVNTRKSYHKWIACIKRKLRSNIVIQFIYYKIMRKNYSGYEDNKLR